MARDTVEQIKERLSILDVVASYVELHKAGKNYKGKSPFTNEKTPSFYVSPDRNMYYCFSSSQGGDIFTFIEKMEGVDFKGALKILAEKAGVELVAEDPKKRSDRDTQYALIEEATKFFFQQLSSNKEAEEYVKARGVEGKTIHVWRIGFAPDAWRDLKEYLSGKGYTEEQMLKAGLVKKSDEAKESYDVFRNRVMFPICDSSGRVVAFSGRTLSKDTETPKYVNSPETELFLKSEILFGYDKAKQGIRQFDFSLIVEGQFDVVLAHQAGYTNTVAVSGTAFTDRHVELLQRLSSRSVLALDSDRAGIAAVKRSAGLMLKRGMDVKVVDIEGGKDPADIIQEDPKKFKAMVGKSVHVVEFLLDVLKRDAKDERAYKLSVREEVLPLLAMMPNRIDREHFEGVVAEALGSTKDSVHYEVERLVSTPEGQREPEEQKSVAKERRYEALLPHVYVSGVLLEGELGELVHQKLKEIISEKEFAMLESLDDSIKNQLLFTLEALYESYAEKDLRRELSEKLTELAMLSARRKLSTLRQMIREAEDAGERERVEKLLRTAGRWEKQLQAVISL